MFRIAIVEDQEETRECLNRFVRQYAEEQGVQVEISLITDGSEIAEHYTPGFDIIFMDVEMPRLDGFAAAEAIRAVDAEVVLVFVTNMAQYAIRGYEVDALDYVLKPVNYYQFCTKLSRAIQRVQRRRGGQVVLQLAGSGIQLLSGTAFFGLVYALPARQLPYKGEYHIEPRQLLGSFFIGILFMVQAAVLDNFRAEQFPRSVIATILIGQFYFITLLYFQSELFKKSAMEKEMNALNLLYERQRQQYQVARQNVQIINKRCHELKVQIADLRKLSPEAVPQERIEEAERAARPECRVIDLLVCVRQGFVVVNIISPLRPPEKQANRSAQYELKVIRRIVQKYKGTLTLEEQGEFFAEKIIFPLQK